MTRGLVYEIAAYCFVTAIFTTVVMAGHRFEAAQGKPPTWETKFWAYFGAIIWPVQIIVLVVVATVAWHQSKPFWEMLEGFQAWLQRKFG